MKKGLRRIYDGFMQLKNEGLAVDAIAPEAAIYLTIKIDLAGKKTPDGKMLADQSEVTAYIINEAKSCRCSFLCLWRQPELSLVSPQCGHL